MLTRLLLGVNQAAIAVRIDDSLITKAILMRRRLEKEGASNIAIETARAHEIDLNNQKTLHQGACNILKRLALTALINDFPEEQLVMKDAEEQTNIDQGLFFILADLLEEAQNSPYEFAILSKLAESDDTAFEITKAVLQKARDDYRETVTLN